MKLNNQIRLHYTRAATEKAFAPRLRKFHADMEALLNNIAIRIYAKASKKVEKDESLKVYARKAGCVCVAEYFSHGQHSYPPAPENAKFLVSTSDRGFDPYVRDRGWDSASYEYKLKTPLYVPHRAVNNCSDSSGRMKLVEAHMTPEELKAYNKLNDDFRAEVTDFVQTFKAIMMSSNDSKKLREKYPELADFLPPIEEAQVMVSNTKAMIPVDSMNHMKALLGVK